MDCHINTTGLSNHVRFIVAVGSGTLTLKENFSGFQTLEVNYQSGLGFGIVNANGYNISVRSRISLGLYAQVNDAATLTITTGERWGAGTDGQGGMVFASDNFDTAPTLVLNIGSSSLTDQCLLNWCGAYWYPASVSINMPSSSNSIYIFGDNTATSFSITGDGDVDSYWGAYPAYKVTVSGTITLTGDTSGGLDINQLELVKASGTVTATNCTISASTASGGATFHALIKDGNIDGGSNTGWVFGSSPPLVELVLQAFSPALLSRITLPAENLELQSFAPLGGVSRVYIPAANLLLRTFGVETNINNRLKYIDRTSIVFEDRASIFWEKEALHQAAAIPVSGLILTGYGPATIGGVITSRVPLSSLLLSPHAPLSGVSRVAIASSSLILTPFPPTGIQIIPALIPAGSLILQAFAPRLIERVSIPASSLILTPIPPGIVQQAYSHIPAVNLVLTAWAPRASIVQYVSIPAASLVLQGFAPLYIWTPSQVHLVTLQNIYLCILTGAADGLTDITIPISSFQSTMRDGDPSYLACVIPNSVDYVAAIAARPNGDIVIRKGYKFSDGSTQTEEIIRVDYESLQVNRGARSDSATISGHKTTSSSNPKSVNLAGVSYYGLQANGKRTFRADPDLFLRVGDTAVYGAESIVVDQISYTVGERQAIMQVTEA
jgi:hypothetical protein